jgi:hypothetical protein
LLKIDLGFRQNYFCPEVNPVINYRQNKNNPMKKQFFLFLVCLAAFSCTHKMAEPETSIVGKWTGTVTQNGGGTSTLFSYEMTITEHTGTMVMGNAYIRDSKDNTLFSHKNLMGTFQNNKFDFEETDIMHQNAPAGVKWLLLSCKTVYATDIPQKLTGSWSSGSYSGTISLTKSN